MKKLIFILLLIYGCSKKKDETAMPAPAQNNSTTLVQDSRVVGNWLLDSIRFDTVLLSGSNLHLVAHLNPPCDSMTFTTDKFKGYGWTGTYYYSATSTWEKWDTPYSDSLFIHSSSAFSVYLAYKYSITTNRMTVFVHDVSGSDFQYFYHK